MREEKKTNIFIFLFSIMRPAGAGREFPP